jgi:stage VI sporulation protein D
VTDQLNGLRFDIYERVHLPDDVAAIEELEEIELVPHMQALPQDDQVLLRGHLLLSGIYRSQDSAGVSQLEHWIPVEITLPLNRIQSVEQLAVEIDNFDVDLLTNRSLNVTGVLALRGLQVQAPQVPIWRDDSFTVVHQAEPEQKEEPPRNQNHEDQNQENFEVEDSANVSAVDYPTTHNGELSEGERIDSWLLQPEPEPEPVSNEASTESSWLSMFQNLEESREEERNDNSVNNDPSEISSWGDVSKQQWLEEAEVIPEPQLLDQPALASEEKTDLKVALGGKPLDSLVRQQSGVGLLSQLGENGAKREAELRILEAAQAEEKALAANNANHSTGDELEWTRLFLNSGSDTHSFRKVKMCIVQREETLDLIATRYNVQPRELQLYNRLHDPYLSEGQVLYIP